MAGALEGDIFIGPKAEVCGMIDSSVGRAWYQYRRAVGLNPAEALKFFSG